MDSTDISLPLNNMEKAAIERKERLSKLKKRNISSNADSQESSTEPPLKFRNFEPQSKTLLSRTDVSSLEKKAAEKDGSENNGITPSEPTVETMVEGIAEAVIEEQKIKMKEDVNLSNLAPTKPNWDLKRDVEKKLSKLERRTQAKIHDIVRDRIKAQNFNSSQNPSQANGEEFVAAINAHIEDEQKSEEEED